MSPSDKEGKAKRMTKFQKERIICPFCKENGRGDVKIEGSGSHSTDYPGTASKISLCGGCPAADFEVHSFQFHRCPKCKTVFVETEP